MISDCLILSLKAYLYTLVGALKMQHWKMRDHEQQGIAGVENARQEYAGSGSIETHCPVKHEYPGSRLIQPWKSLKRNSVKFTVN